MSNEITAFADVAISKKNKSITDEVFLLIQNDKDFDNPKSTLIKSYQEYV